jgi:hypothetical protein
MPFARGSGKEALPDAWWSAGIGCSARQHECLETWALYARSHRATPTALRADASIAQASPEDLVNGKLFGYSAETTFPHWDNYLPPFSFGALRKRTPGPPPSALMNSIPATCKAFRIFSPVSLRPPSGPSPASNRFIVGSETRAAAARFSCDQAKRARAAFIWRIETFSIDRFVIQIDTFSIEYGPMVR